MHDLRLIAQAMQAQQHLLELDSLLF